MKLNLARTFAAAGLVALAAVGTAAQARDNVYWSLGVASPGVAIGVGNVAPVYVAPPPVYVAPPPVYYAPRPVVVAPAPVYYGGPVYYGYGKHKHKHRGHGRGHGRGHDRHWD